MIRTGRVRLSILKVNGKMDNSGCWFEVWKTRLAVDHMLERSAWVLKICIEKRIRSVLPGWYFVSMRSPGVPCFIVLLSDGSPWKSMTYLHINE